MSIRALPRPRGPISSALLSVLRASPASGPAADLEGLHNLVCEHLEPPDITGTAGLIEDDDVQLALFCLYELHYGGFTQVDDAWEWEPELLRIRAAIEGAFEDELRARVPVPQDLPQGAAEISEALFALAAADDSPSTAKFIAKRADVEQVREFLMLRSIYQLKEADPHTWAIPRLAGRPKAALVEIQTDEYGGGQFERMHSKLFADSMTSLGLDGSYGAYLDRVPGYLLASMNMMSLFGLHRRLRGAITGHLAAYEMTSSIPCQLISSGFARLGLQPAAAYFDEHIEADAVHEQIASRDLAGGLGELEPELIPDIFFGAAACLRVDGWAGARMIEAWENNEKAVLA